MVEELVHRAASNGLDVRVRFEGDLDGTTGPVARLAFRSVQEGVTNALRHAPGAAVRVTVAGKGRGLVVRVENDRPGGDQWLPLQGAGRGLRGLRERAEDLRLGAVRSDTRGRVVPRDPARLSRPRSQRDFRRVRRPQRTCLPWHAWDP